MKTCKCLKLARNSRKSQVQPHEITFLCMLGKTTFCFLRVMFETQTRTYEVKTFWLKRLV